MTTHDQQIDKTLRAKPFHSNMTLTCPFKHLLPAHHPDWVIQTKRIKCHPSYYWIEPCSTNKPEPTYLQITTNEHIKAVYNTPNHVGTAYHLLFHDELIFPSATLITNSPADHQLLTKGNKIIFDNYQPGFTYELARIWNSTETHHNIEIVAFNHQGDYHSEASQSLFPCIISIPLYYVDVTDFEKANTVLSTSGQSMETRLPLPYFPFELDYEYSFSFPFPTPL